MLFAGLAPSPELFGLFRFITGLGLGGMMPNVIGLISEYSPEGLRSRMIATIMAGYSIGGVVAAFLSMILITNFGWAVRILLWCSSIIASAIFSKIITRLSWNVSGEK